MNPNNQQWGSHTAIDNQQNGKPPLGKPSDWTILDMGGMTLRHLSPSLFKFKFLTELYLNNNQLVQIPHHISQLSLLTKLDASCNQISSIPSQIGMVSSLKELILFNNNISQLPHEIGFLFNLKVINLSGNPLSDHLMTMEVGSLITFLRDSCPGIFIFIANLLHQVENPPPEREWIVLNEHETPITPVSPNAFTVLSYNILADKYATAQAYAYTPTWVLHWDYRKDLILQELLNYNADIICLQEIETGQYEDFFKEQLHQIGGYESVFYPKSRSRTMDDFQRRFVDGCATFYKKQKFTLIDSTLVEFQQSAMKRHTLRESQDVYNRVMIKDNIATLTYLKNLEGANIVIGNAHLHWDPLFKDVKLIQTTILMEELVEFTTKIKTPTIIIAGDFNSLPESGVYEFISSAQLAKDHPDFSSYTYGKYTQNGLTHPFHLKSAYSHINSNLFTNYTPTFQGVIDYIFYSTHTCQVTGLLGGVDQNYISRVVGFPNWHHPSDHIPLLINVKFKSLN